MEILQDNKKTGDSFFVVVRAIRAIRETRAIREIRGLSEHGVFLQNRNNYHFPRIEK